ncbi:MAG TPA: FliM/FliN family flagellar motor switch protein [Arsenophonus sp.]
MIKNYFPRKSHKEINFKQLLLTWQKKGISESVFPLPKGEFLLSFSTNKNWKGIIDLSEWLELINPNLNGLSMYAWKFEELETLFLNSYTINQFLPFELEFNTIYSNGKVNCDDSDYKNILTMIRTDYGNIWIHDIDNNLNSKIKLEKYKCNHIPVELILRVGYSNIVILTLNKVNIGDILFINQQTYDVFIENKVIGHFTNDNGVCMVNANFDNENMDHTMYEDNTLINVSNKIKSKDNIPIKLEYILQRSKIPLSELENIFQGKVLPCDLAVENNVEIVANGILIAKGNIIWVEDRLGVEITDLFHNEK